MDLKKMLALAMLVLVALPSLTIVGAANGVGPAGAIERARIYLDKVMTSAEKTAALYPYDDDMQGYLNDLYALLGRYEYEGPEFLLKSENGIAELSDVESYSGNYSAHLKTTGNPGTGDEARIVIPMPDGFTLGDIETISWWTYLVSGYIPHVDIFTEVETLVAEGAHVNDNDITGWPTDTWFSTFDGASGVYTTPERGMTGSTTLLTTVNSETAVWYSAGDASSLHTLGEFQTPTLVDGMNESTLVTKIEIEVDNWIEAAGNAEAYVDDIKIDGPTYDFEEREEEGKAKYYLDQASASLVEGDIRSAARSLASARNIIGRINGLLKSMAKVHKVARAEKFNQKFQRRIQGIEDKIERLKGPKNK